MGLCLKIAKDKEPYAIKNMYNIIIPVEIIGLNRDYCKMLYYELN